MYNNSKSETKFITHGVPQGSILGPLFFIVFMNDFSRASNLLFSILFADDTTVIIEGQNYNNLILTLNTELNKLDVWLQANKLTLNTDKTHYMVFHRARIKSQTGKISIRNNAIDEVKSTKFLGVIIDDKLKWTEHLQYIKNKISKSIGILIKIRPYLDKVTLRNLYFTFVYPYLIYCVEVWGNACDTHLEPIIKIQKKCVRVITFSHYLEPTYYWFCVMCKPILKCSLGSLARLSTLSQSYLLTASINIFVLCSVYLVEYTLHQNLMIEIHPEL